MEVGQTGQSEVLLHRKVLPGMPLGSSEGGGSRTLPHLGPRRCALCLCPGSPGAAGQHREPGWVAGCSFQQGGLHGRGAQVNAESDGSRSHSRGDSEVPVV